MCLSLRLSSSTGSHADSIARRGSPDPAGVPDRRSPSFGVCSESTNSFEARAYDERGRPLVRHPGVDPSGARRPAPNVRNLPNEQSWRRGGTGLMKSWGCTDSRFIPVPFRLEPRATPDDPDQSRGSNYSSVRCNANECKKLERRLKCRLFQRQV